MTIRSAHAATLLAALLSLAAAPAVAQMRITEYMYSGSNGEFVEFTNVGATPVDMTGWSFDDSSEVAGSQDLSAYGVVQPGQSVILADAGVTAAAFRAAWSLCDAVKVIGGNTNNLGRDDEINLYDAGHALVDRLAYGDDTALGGPRANGASAWPSASALGANVIADWTLSTVGDAEGSVASSGADIGSPGRSTRATVAFDPCASAERPTVAIDHGATSPYLDLADGSAGAVGAVIDDPTDPAATAGIGFTFALPGGGDPASLAIAVASSNPAVVDASGLVLQGGGETRQLRIVPHGVGYATITVSATDAQDRTGTYAIAYAASAPATTPAATRFHSGASDASATIALDADTMLVADDETNVLRLYDRTHSGLPFGGYDPSGELALTDPDNPELDLEGGFRAGTRSYWTGSFSNSKNFHVRPNRHRVFAIDLAGAGVATTFAYAGRYDWLLEDLVAWDAGNGHGLGANALGFAASSAEGVDSKTSAGFNVEGLALAPDGSTAYLAFRAPQLPTTQRHEALIVPVLDFDALVTGAAPGSRAPGSATFGAPILFDLGGRGIRSIDRNASGQYLIIAGPPGDATGVAPADFRLYAWTGQPQDAPFDLGVDLTALDVAGGSFESVAEVPDPLGLGSVLQLLFDDGDSVFYGDGVLAKDLAEPRWKKAASLRVGVDVVFPAAALAVTGGTPQSTPVGTSFADPLALRVIDAYGHPVAGVTVTFAAPAEGASAVLSSTSAVTDADGRTSVTASANAVQGDYVVTAHVNGVAGGVSFALSNGIDEADVIFRDGFDAAP
ncbi:MAG TPA: lamin tail domain-containing protein [Dokdonella sp.]|nr:lamin tail domain-containing protein [Dokdonella sp.]